MKRLSVLFAAAASVVISIWLLPASCAREPKFYLPKVGQKYEFMPAVMNSTAPVRSEREDLGAVHMTVRWGGRALDKDRGNPRLNFYGKNSDTPIYSALWADLETAYKTSGCKNEQIETLDGPMPGVTLICDGRIKLSEIERIEAVDDSGETKSCDAFSTYQRADDVLAIIVQLY